MLAANEEIGAAEQTDFLPTEAQEQMRVFAWIDAHLTEYPALRWAFHPPNGELRDIGTAVKLKGMGARAGVPDILIPAQCGAYAGCAIELKRIDHSSKATAEQREWIAHLHYDGWYAQVCYGAAAAIDEIRRYLGVY